MMPWYRDPLAWLGAAAGFFLAMFILYLLIESGVI